MRVRCASDKISGLLRLLDSGDRLALFDLRDVDYSLACGLFTVPKASDRDRLVLDARPANCYEEAEDRWIRSLGDVSQLQFAFLHPGSNYRVFSEDLREFYHAFVVGEERASKNLPRLRLSPEACRGLKAWHPGLANAKCIVPALKTLAMGDVNGVALAQAAHLSVILSSRALTLDSLVTLSGRPPRSGPLGGLLIDDLVILDPVPASLAPGEPSAGTSIIKTIRHPYAHVGLPRHESKAVFAEPRGSFWGCTFDGASGLVAPNLDRAVPLASLLLDTVEVRVGTRELLESLVGGVSSCFQ